MAICTECFPGLSAEDAAQYAGQQVWEWRRSTPLSAQDALNVEFTRIFTDILPSVRFLKGEIDTPPFQEKPLCLM